MQRLSSLGKTLMLGKVEGNKKWTNSKVDGLSYIAAMGTPLEELNELGA